MVWFSGSIPSAIQQARESVSLFIVVIVDDSDESSVLEALFLEDQFSEFLAQSAVSLRLDAASPDAISFSQLYPISKVPSVFVVNSLTGALMEVLGLPFEADSAIARLRQHHANLSVTPPLPLGQAQQQQQQQQEEVVGKKPLTEEEKKAELARLREKVAAKMKEKEAEKELERETRRRKEGAELMQAREKLEDQQMKQLAEQRKREKREDEEARKRIKEQIARDREDSARERERLRNPTPPVVESNISQPTAQGDSSSLVIRMTNGSVLKNRFAATETLGTVRDYIDQNRTDGNGPYTLVVNFPYHNLTDSDMVTSLRDLGFVPSATIILKPAATVSQAYSGGSVIRPVLPQSGPGFSFHGSIIAPLMALFLGLWHMIFPPTQLVPPHQQRMDAEAGNLPPAARQNPGSSGPPPKVAGRESKIRQISDLNDDGTRKPEDT